MSYVDHAARIIDVINASIVTGMINFEPFENGYKVYMTWGALPYQKCVIFIADNAKELCVYAHGLAYGAAGINLKKQTDIQYGNLPSIPHAGG